MADDGWSHAHVAGTAIDAGSRDGADRRMSRRSVLAATASGLGAAATRVWSGQCGAEAARPATAPAWWERLLPGSIGIARAACDRERAAPAPRRWTEADLDRLLSIEHPDMDAPTAPHPATVAGRAD